jgi:hypothetical protein
MADYGRCGYPGCGEPSERRCYFCPNRFSLALGVITAGSALCWGCSAQQRQQQEERDKVAQARPQSSGCLIAVASLAVIVLLAVVRSRGESKPL